MEWRVGSVECVKGKVWSGECGMCGRCGVWKVWSVKFGM